MIFQKTSAALCFKYPSTHINNNYDDDYDDKGLCYIPLGLSCDYISNDKDNEIHTQLIIFPINLYGEWCQIQIIILYERKFMRALADCISASSVTIDITMAR